MDGKELRIIRAARKKLMRRLVGVGLSVGVLVGLVIWFAVFMRNRETALPGVFYPPVGVEHIPLGSPSPTPYNSNPPASGGHFGSQANWGIYDYEVHDQIFMHNLEHGGIWIAYRPAISPEAVRQLKEIVNEYGGSKFVMAPRSLNDADVAIVAWTRVLKFDLTGGKLSDDQIEGVREFYKAFKNRGPEFVPDTMPGIDPKEVQKTLNANP